jgi:hypothetical protein
VFQIRYNSQITHSWPPESDLEITCTFLKRLELFVLDRVSGQFSFVDSRGTNMAVSLTHGVIKYCVSRDIPVFACSLDAEGAYDVTPCALQ